MNKKTIFATSVLAVCIAFSPAMAFANPNKMVIDLSKPTGSPDREKMVEMTDAEVAQIEQQRLQEKPSEPTEEQITLRALELKNGITAKDLEAAKADLMDTVTP